MKIASTSLIAFRSKSAARTKIGSDGRPRPKAVEADCPAEANAVQPAFGRCRLRELVAAYQASESETRKRLLVAQICPELHRRRQQKERAFYQGVQEMLDCGQRSSTG